MKNIILFILFIIIPTLALNAQSLNWENKIDFNRTSVYSPSICFDNNTSIVTYLREKNTDSGFYNNLIVAQYFDINGNEIFKKEYKPFNVNSISNASILDVNSTFIGDQLFNKGYFSTLDSNYLFFSVLNKNTNSVIYNNIPLKQGESVVSCEFVDGTVEVYISNMLEDTLNFYTFDNSLELQSNSKISIQTSNKFVRVFQETLYLISYDISANNFISFTIEKYNNFGSLLSSNKISNIIQTQSVQNNFSVQEISFSNDKLLIKAKNIHKNNNVNISNLESNLFFVVIDTNNLTMDYLYSINDPNTTSPTHIPDNGQSYMYSDNKLSVLCKNILDGNILRVYSYCFQNGNLLFKKQLEDSTIVNFNTVSVINTINSGNSVINIYNLPSNYYLIQKLDLNGNQLLAFKRSYDTLISYGLILSSIINNNYLYLLSTVNYNTFTDNDILISNLSDILNSIEYKKDNKVSIYPNPATNIAIISIDKIKEVHLYNTLGEKIKTYYHTNILNTDDLPQGIYSLKIITSSKDVYTHKLIVAK